MLIEHSSIQDAGLFKSAVLADRHTRLYFRATGGEVVAVKTENDNYCRLFYMRLTPPERRELEGLEEFGGDAAYRGRLPFLWNDELNEARATEYLNQLESKSASMPPPPPSVPEGFRGNLAEVEMVREDAPRKAQIVKG